MAVKMDQVRRALDPEEPDYEKGARLGPEALPHLAALVESGDTLLASKAAYLASLIDGAQAGEIVQAAARSEDAVLRVAAAGAAVNLEPDARERVLENLIEDPDPGVTKVARQAVPEGVPSRLSRRLEELQQAEGGPAAAPSPETAAPSGDVPGLMPGEKAGPTRTDGRMPGE